MSAQGNHINQTKDTHCAYVSGASHLRIEPLTELKYMEFRYNKSRYKRVQGIKGFQARAYQVIGGLPEGPSYGH